MAFDKVAAPEFRGGHYEVCHYPTTHLGACVGPLGIDQTLVFCHELDVRLKDPGAFVTVEYEPEDRHNVAVVVGVYLILGQRWSAKQVGDALPEDALLTLPCSWVQAQDLLTEHGAPRMRVLDCWEGVQMARDKMWLHEDSVTDGVLASLSATKFRKTSEEYDGAWLVPGDVMVMADPMTTINDPDPKTCSTFSRDITESTEASFQREVSDDVASSASKWSQGKSPTRDRGTVFWAQVACECNSVGGSPAAGAAEAQDDFAARQSPGTSQYTVCKFYDPAAAGAGGSNRLAAKPFVDFLLDEGIGCVVRVNRPDEPGLREFGGSYDPAVLTQAGIWHADVPVSDSKSDRAGAVPQRGAVRRFLSLAEEVGPEESGAVLVHCKGGFGRSVFLACLLVIYRYDVPGRGLLGWARIARPGAITTPEQEDALRALTGRADLCRRYGVAAPGQQAVRACCSAS
jgi:protein-tyrosine phosphatase